MASGGHSSSRCVDLSLLRPRLLRSTGSRRAGSAIVAHGPSCSGACGIFPDQGSNPCPPHWQADSQPLRHQGSPSCFLILLFLFILQPMFYPKFVDSATINLLPDSPLSLPETSALVQALIILTQIHSSLLLHLPN